MNDRGANRAAHKRSSCPEKPPFQAMGLNAAVTPRGREKSYHNVCVFFLSLSCVFSQPHGGCRQTHTHTQRWSFWYACCGLSERQPSLLYIDHYFLILFISNRPSHVTNWRSGFQFWQLSIWSQNRLQKTLCTFLEVSMQPHSTPWDVYFWVNLRLGLDSHSSTIKHSCPFIYSPWWGGGLLQIAQQRSKDTLHMLRVSHWGPPEPF